MLNFLINFCLFVFILYAVWGSARAILFGSKGKRKRAYHAESSTRRSQAQRNRTQRKAQIIKLRTHTTRKPQRKHSSAAALCA